MDLDVVDLDHFYRRTPLGRAAADMLARRVSCLWPEIRGEALAGFGFALPVLERIGRHAARTLALMPGRIGVRRWPEAEKGASRDGGAPGNRAVLVAEEAWPLGDSFLDRLVIMHGLEIADDPVALLHEAWRVLAPGGRALVIVPNRAGFWARAETTPFGHGRPYSSGQIERLLRQCRFMPTSHASALYMPPSARRFWLRVAPLWERIGQRLPMVTAGGALIVEAEKQVYAPRKGGLPELVRGPLTVIEGFGRPAPAAGRAEGRGRGWARSPERAGRREQG